MALSKHADSVLGLCFSDRGQQQKKVVEGFELTLLQRTSMPHHQLPCAAFVQG